MTSPSSGYRWADRDAINDDLKARLKKARRYIRKDRWKRYEILRGAAWERVVGVTSAIGVMDKPALVKWAANVQAEADEQAALDMYLDGTPTGLSPQAWLAMFRDRVGHTRKHLDILKKAGDLGTAVHALIEERVGELLGESRPIPDNVTITDEALYVFTGWEEWQERVQFMPVATEFPICHRGLGYAGTPDVLAWLNPYPDVEGCEPQLMLPDWKTSSGLYWEHDIQNAAYRTALIDMEVLTEPIDGYLLRVPKSLEDQKPFEGHTVSKDDDERLMGVFKACLTIHPVKTIEEKAGLERWKATKAMERAQAGQGAA